MFFLNATLRAESASTFGDDGDNTFLFPSASLAWQFTELPGLKSDFFSFGKLRFSYGPPATTRLMYSSPRPSVTSSGATWPAACTATALSSPVPNAVVAACAPSARKKRRSASTSASCTTASADCLRSVSLPGDSGGSAGTFPFFASFPIYAAAAEWTALRTAVIVVHGANRNADDYFGWLMNTLQAENREEEVVLIAPNFKNAAEAAAGEFYWPGTDWREGQLAASTARISSFAVIDRLIDQLADRDHFPALERVIVIGQSSGALFTHLYAGANAVEEQYAHLDFQYLVGESQYFYYPDGRRIDPATDQLYTPTDCTGYDLWPIGYRILPAYLNDTDAATYNERFLGRSVTYLLGNGSGPDGALNTTDCYATLLGPTRYQRGENMFRYLELAFPDHRHERVVVPGVAHDAAELYSSATFRDLLRGLSN